MLRLRTELWTATVLRFRTLGPMLTAPAGELWQQFRAFGPAIPTNPSFFEDETSPIDCLLKFDVQLRS